MWTNTQHENATADEKKSWNLQRQIFSGCCDTKRKREIGQKKNLRWNWTTWDSLRCHMYYIICVPFGAARQAYEPSVVLCCCCRWRLMWRPLSDEMRWDASSAKHDLCLINELLPFFLQHRCRSIVERKKYTHPQKNKHLKYLFALQSWAWREAKPFTNISIFYFLMFCFFLPQQDIHSSVEPTTDTDSVNTKRYVSMHVSL